jgi:hypothetical protein
MTARICTSCAASAPGMSPAGWIIEPVRAPIGPRGLTIIVGERAYCLDCQHPELATYPTIGEFD